MKEITVRVTDPVGLHARPATIAVSAANKVGCDVTIEYKNREIDMKSIMAVMSLGIPSQADIVIKCEGKDEEEAIQKIEETLRTNKVIA